MLFHLGAGEGGIAAFGERYHESFHRWWDDLGDPRLDAATAERPVAGIVDAGKGQDRSPLAARRDRLLRAMLKATGPRPR